VALFLSPQRLNAEPVKSGWDANDPAEGVEGYKLYWGNASGDYCCWLDVGAVTESGIIDIPLDSYIAATAYLVCTQENVDYTNPNNPDYVNRCQSVGQIVESSYSTEILFASIASACCGSINYQWTDKVILQMGKDYETTILPDGSPLFILPDTGGGDIWEW
jgi:hypothetical protein